jgi:hypothetical protein
MLNFSDIISKSLNIIMFLVDVRAIVHKHLDIHSWSIPNTTWITVTKVPYYLKIQYRTPYQDSVFNGANIARIKSVGFEAFTAVTMKNVVFWDVATSRYCVNWPFGGTYRLHLQGRKICRLQPLAHAGSSLADFSTLKMEAIRSSETSVHTRSTRRHIPEDDILRI